MFTLKLTKLIHEKVCSLDFYFYDFIFVYIVIYSTVCLLFKGYKILYKEGCDVTISKANGTVHSPAYKGGMYIVDFSILRFFFICLHFLICLFTFPPAAPTYPPNQNCVIRISNPYQGGRLSLKFNDMDVGAGDTVQVRILCLHFFSREINCLFTKKKEKKFRDPAKFFFKGMYVQS